MQIKGDAVIQLKNVHTGEVKEYRHENSLTSFTSDLFQEPGVFGYKPTKLLSSVDRSPLDNMFGGILLYDSTISGLPTYVPAGATMVGNGSINNSAENSNLPELGSYNQVDSEAQSTSTKRVYIYEWKSYQALGDINSICLTSPVGGYDGTGYRVYTDASQLPKADYCPLGTRRAANSNNNDLGYYNVTSGDMFQHCMTAEEVIRFGGIDFTDGQAYLATVPQGTDNIFAQGLKKCFIDGSITIGRYSMPVHQINPFLSQRYFSNYIQPENKIDDLTFSITPHSDVQFAYLTGGRDYLLLVGFTHIYSSYGSWVTYFNISNNNPQTIYIQEFKRTGNTWAVGRTFTSTCVSGQQSGELFRVSTNGSMIEKSYLIPYGDTNGINFIMINATSNNQTWLIKTDGTVTEATAPLGSSSTGGNYLTFNQNGRILILGKGYYDPVLNIYSTINIPVSSNYTPMAMQNLDSENFIGFLGTSITTSLTNYIPRFQQLPCNWLATVNNLSEPIQKTADYTMKIIYTLTLQTA